MATRALVLGGGGTVGIAWELGVAAGLLAEGVDLRNADLFVGTSAGSVVGSLLATGLDPQVLVQFQLQEASEAEAAMPALDTAAIAAIFQKWESVAEMTEPLRREIGQMALKAKTPPEAMWLGVFENLLPGLTWPERALKLTAVNAETGAFQVWDKDSGVTLIPAVASSCTVPGMFPPVSIGEARYVDGGVRSVTNADLAQGYDQVVLIAPLAQEGRIGHRQLMAEAEGLRAAGAQVEIVRPDAAALAAFGPNVMDARFRAAGAREGVRQGREGAAMIGKVWA